MVSGQSSAYSLPEAIVGLTNYSYNALWPLFLVPPNVVVVLGMFVFPPTFKLCLHFSAQTIRPVDIVL